VRLLGALDVETHEARQLTHVVALAFSICTADAALSVLQAVAETLLNSLIDGGAIKPAEVAERDGVSGALHSCFLLRFTWRFLGWFFFPRTALSCRAPLAFVMPTQACGALKKTACCRRVRCWAAASRRAVGV
jgi:hypothetical protein